MKVNFSSVESLRLASIRRYEDSLADFNPPIASEVFKTLSHGAAFSKHYENFHPNHLYGSGAILRSHYGIEARPLPLVIPHGVRFGDHVWSLELLCKFPILAYSFFSMLGYEIVMQGVNGKRPSFVLHRTPYQIVSDVRRPMRAKLEAKRRGCVFFPYHSTPRFPRDIHNLTPSFLRDIEIIRSKYGKVDLCLYYSDYLEMRQNGVLDLYCSNFDLCLCCGDRADPAFLVRLEEILSSHELVITESWGSVNFYALISGCNVGVCEGLTPSMTERGVATPEASKHTDRQKRLDVFMNRFLGEFFEGCTSTRIVQDQDGVRSFVSAREDDSAVRRLIKSFTSEVHLKSPFSVYGVVDTLLLDRVV